MIDVNKVRQLLTKEINDRKVYVDALEAVDQLDDLYTEKKMMEADIASLKNQGADLKVQLEQIKKDALAILDEAKAKAATITASSQQDADALIARAQQKVFEVENEAKTKSVKINDLDRVIVEKNDEIADAVKRKDDLEDLIEKTKAAFKELN